MAPPIYIAFRHDDDKLPHQEDFIKGLLELHKKQPLPFTDFTIVCDDGEVEAQRVILAVRSKYFDAFFRQEGYEVRSLSVPQFSRAVMLAIVKSLLVVDVKAIEQAGCKEVLEAADYFQIKHLFHEVIEIIKEKITEENFIEYAQVADLFNACFLYDCARVGQRKLATFQKHMELGTFHALSTSILIELFQPLGPLRDQQKRPLDDLQTQLYLLNMIFSILKDTGRLDDFKKCRDFEFEYIHLFLDDSIDPSQFGKYACMVNDYRCIVPDANRREEIHKNLLMHSSDEDSAIWSEMHSAIWYEMRESLGQCPEIMLDRYLDPQRKWIEDDERVPLMRCSHVGHNHQRPKSEEVKWR